MVAGCGNKCVKFFMFFINFLICISGLGIMGVSLWANLDKSFVSHLQKVASIPGIAKENLGQYTVAIWVLVGIGAFLFLTGFLGCCGAACENRLLLGLFFVIVLICFLAELAAGISIFVLRNKFKTELTKTLDQVWANSDARNDKAFTDFEATFNCCGVNGTEPNRAEACKDVKFSDKKPYSSSRKGCVEVVWKLAEDNAVITAGIGLAILAVELLAMIFTCIMCNAAESKSRYGYH